MLQHCLIIIGLLFSTVSFADTEVDCGALAIAPEEPSAATYRKCIRSLVEELKELKSEIHFMKMDIVSIQHWDKKHRDLELKKELKKAGQRDK